MASTIYVASLPAQGRGVAMQPSRRSNGGRKSGMQYYFRGRRGNIRRDCVAWKATQLPNGGGGKTQWCSFHMTSNQGEDECRVLQGTAVGPRAQSSRGGHTTQWSPVTGRRLRLSSQAPWKHPTQTIPRTLRISGRLLPPTTQSLVQRQWDNRNL